MYTHTYTSLRQATVTSLTPPHPIPNGVWATFPPVSEPVNHRGAATVLKRTETLSQRVVACDVEIIFISLSSVPCLCATSCLLCSVCAFDSPCFSLFFSSSPFHLSLLFSLAPSVSLCLQSDVMASVQNRRRLGIWWCGACKWSLCQGCLF